MKDETKKERLADLLRMHRIKYKPIATNMRSVSDPDEAVAFSFDVRSSKTSDPVTVIVSMDDENNLNMFFDSDAHDSTKFTKLVPAVKRFAVINDMKFNGEALDTVGNYMKKREKEMRNAENEVTLNEGYKALSSQRSLGDHVPTVKIIIEHNRKLGEGEQRFRSINRIFVENTQGERILTPVRETSLAKVFARVIAEGDLPHGQRWQHVEQITEEFQKIRDFIRATKHQINEHELVSVGRGHYQTLRETLSKLTGHRGYNQYFESWQPSLIEDQSVDISDLHEDGTDPRIVEAMPILYRLQKSQIREQVVESKEVAALESWADGIIYSPIFEDEVKDAEAARKKLEIPAITRQSRGARDPNWKLTKAELDAIPAASRTTSQGLAAHAKRVGIDEEDKVDEDLDADQKRAGQLGPTEKVGPKGAVGKLVGTSEGSDPMVAFNESQEMDDILQLAKMINR